MKVLMINKGMVFGVFDGLHEGHKKFLSDAAARCTKLIVVVAHPEAVLALKKRHPLRTLEDRIGEIRSFNPRLEVVTGDATLGEWRALKNHRPDMVLLGYDQKQIAEELKIMNVPFTFLEAHCPSEFKSSLLDKKKE